MKLDINELDTKLIFDLITDIACFLIIGAWDFVASSFSIQHNQGFGAGQILTMGFFGIRVYIDWVYLRYHGK